MKIEIKKKQQHFLFIIAQLIPINKIIDIDALSCRPCFHNEEINHYLFEVFYRLYQK